MFELHITCSKDISKLKIDFTDGSCICTEDPKDTKDSFEPKESKKHKESKEPKKIRETQNIEDSGNSEDSVCCRKMCDAGEVQLLSSRGCDLGRICSFSGSFNVPATSQP